MALDHKILKLISMNEQDFEMACQWFRETPPEVKEHIWRCIQEMCEPEDDSEEQKVMELVGRFAQLGMALVAEREYRRYQ